MDRFTKRETAGLAVAYARLPAARAKKVDSFPFGGWRRRNFLAVMGTLFYGILLLALTAAVAFAGETERRRVDISLSIFPRIVAVDNDFRSKLGEERTAHLLFVFDSDRANAEGLAEELLQKTDNIGGMRVATSVADINRDLPLGKDLPTAIFLAERLPPAKLEAVMRYAGDHHRLVFSPYTGDVERGVTVGISVTSRVKPYFNMAALRDTQVNINAILMKVSARYE